MNESRDILRFGANQHSSIRTSQPSGAPTSEFMDADPPVLPRPRMPLAQRAKIFIPFDPLKGYQEALRAKEHEAEQRTDLR